MRRPRILIAESNRFSPAAAQLLRSAGDLTLADLDRSALLRESSQADVLWVRLRNRIDAELLRGAPSLRAVATPTTGLNHIDVEAANRQGIKVISLRGETKFLENIRATAELTMGLLLSLLRQIPQAHEHARGGQWNRDQFLGRELYQRTVGVVGYGRLGRIVARYLQVFGARVLVCDPLNHHKVDRGIQAVDLETLLDESSVVSLHVNLTPSTERFFSQAHFERMRPNAYFINTARGELVDEAALLNALQTSRLAGAAVDVISREEHRDSIPSHPVLRYAKTHSNLIVTPHIGGCTSESMEKTELFMAQMLVEWIAREWPRAGAGRNVRAKTPTQLASLGR